MEHTIRLIVAQLWVLALSILVAASWRVTGIGAYALFTGIIYIALNGMAWSMDASVVRVILCFLMGAATALFLTAIGAPLSATLLLSFVITLIAYRDIKNKHAQAVLDFLNFLGFAIVEVSMEVIRRFVKFKPDPRHEETIHVKVPTQ